MSNNSFFKPTQLYKEFMILDLIEKNSQITQREIAQSVNVAVSMINNHLDDYESNGLIKRKKHSSRSVEYLITKKGAERRKVLNISYLKSSLKVYNFAKENIFVFLNQIINKGFKNILLYGAGEVAEILLQSIVIDNSIPLKILAVIDDDLKKQNHTLIDSKIISLDSAKHIIHDGILISSYTNSQVMLNNLLNTDYDKNKIIHFFD